jgi:hypothetical protein
MSTTAFAQLDRERLQDESYAEGVRIERLSGAGKLCASCFGTDIEPETNLGVACWHCRNCDERWFATKARP